MGLSEFLGNPQAMAAMRAMLTSGRVPGAMLFTGPEGVGKKTLALMLAKALVCERGQGDFCGECGRCRKAEEMLAATREDLARRRLIKDSQKRVDGLVYFDVQLVEPITRFVLSEQVRQIRNVAYTHPFELPRRIFVLDQAQAIHWQAIDLLLKMLEEPPPTTTFILVCPNAYELRPTIRSRCHKIQFVPADDTVIAQVLARENRIPPSRRELAARVAGGSIGRATNLDLAQFDRRRQPWVDFFEAITGSRRGDRVDYQGEAALRAETARLQFPGAGSAAPSGLAELDWASVFESARTLTQDRDTFEETLAIGYAMLRDLMQALECGAGAKIVNVDIDPQLHAWASRLGFVGIELVKRGLDDCYRLQSRNVNQELGIETLAMDVNASLLQHARSAQRP
jgi:DNA polymerase III delta prime subunit